ncbi:hypothetical protein BX666DRAFT_2017304 [Dichotomocladium elegans]|nr:hypothetical protein BX666DRAFT_2017304 [Dichotomocladium elegans]
MSVMNSLNVIDSLEFLDDDAIIACRRMQLLVDDKSRSVNDCEDEIHLIKSNSTNHNVKLAAKVIVSIIHLLRQSTSDVRQEATLIIEALRPFIHNTIVLPTDGAKMEWMTYHVLPPSGYRHCQAMAPDFVLYVDPLSTINFELFFVEVKRKGNFGNGHLESDIVKLGKEMQIGLTKLVQYKVECPEVVGLLIEDGSKATAYRMDLLYNGQYRMVELSNFHFIRQTPDDILLVPTILEKLQQLQKIISRTMTKLYKAVNGEQEEVLEEKLSYIRDA